MAGISSKAANLSPNKEKTFQGQRFDDELGLNWIQFKWRNHDPQIGRFIEIDPLSEEYEYNSTYAFSENHVTSHVELEGLEKASIQFVGNKNHHAAKDLSVINLDRAKMMNSTSKIYDETKIAPTINTFPIQTKAQEIIEESNYTTSVSETVITTNSKIENNEAGLQLVTTTMKTTTTANLYIDKIEGISVNSSTQTSSSKIVADDPKANIISIDLKSPGYVIPGTQTKATIPLSNGTTSNLKKLPEGLAEKTLEALMGNAVKLDNAMKSLDQAQKDFK